MEENNVKEVVEEIKTADEETLKATVEAWYEKTRTQGMKLGALYICAAIEGACRKHLKKGSQSSRRDYERCIEAILKITSVQTQQNDLEEITEEVVNDGPTE